MQQIMPVSIVSQLVTTTVTPAEKDLVKYYVTPGKGAAMAVQSVISAANAATDSGSVTTVLQSSATTVDSDFSAITNGAFAAVVDTDAPTTAGAMEAIYFALPNDRYVRAVCTVAGTPLLCVSVNLYMVKRSS